MTTTGNGEPAASLWGFEYARLSVFFRDREPQSGLWQKIVGIQPEQVESQPRTPAVREQGGTERVFFDLKYKATRLDWTLLPAVSGQLQAGNLSHLAVARDELVALLGAALQVTIRECGTLTRLAYAALASQSVSSCSAGVETSTRASAFARYDSPCRYGLAT